MNYDEGIVTLKITLNEYLIACKSYIFFLWHPLMQLSSYDLCIISRNLNFLPLSLGFRRNFIIATCWHCLVWIQVLCYALHAIVLKWLWMTQELLTSMILTSILEFWYGSFQSFFVWDGSSSPVLTNVFCSSAGLWTSSREPCKFCSHANDLSLVVTLTRCWNVFVIST